MTFRRIKWFGIGTLLGSLLVLVLSLPTLAVVDSSDESDPLSPETEAVSTDEAATATDEEEYGGEEELEIATISEELEEEAMVDVSADMAEAETLGTTTFKAGDNVNVTGTYDNDVIVAGNNVYIDAVVDGDVLAVGATVTITGRVEGNIRVAGGTVNIEGEVARNATMSGGWINVTNTAKIGKDAIVWGGTVNMDGEVGGSLFGSGGTISLDGPVAGNAEMDAGTLSVGKDANIGGDLKYSAGADASISSSAVVAGETVKEEPPAETAEPAEERSLSKQIGWKLIWWVSNLLIGLLLVYLFPKCIKGTGGAMFDKAGHSFLWGLLILFVSPIVLVLLLVTVIGIPISILGFIAYGVGIYVASVFLGIALGNKMMPKMENPILPMVVGVTVIYILKLIPFVGGLVGFVAALWVLGAWIVYLKEKREGRTEGKENSATMKEIEIAKERRTENEEKRTSKKGAKKPAGKRTKKNS